jgi:hypothetical protein
MSKIKDFSIEENIYNYKHLFSLIIKLKSFSISKRKKKYRKNEGILVKSIQPIYLFAYFTL